MHRISATPGGWNQSDGLVFLEQTPAPFVLITAADTDIQTLAATVPKLPAEFPQIRVANLLQLQQQISIDTYGEQVLELAQVIVLRLLGGSSYWAYGLKVVQEIAASNGITLIVMPGDDALDPDLISKSTISTELVNQVWQYFREGGIENFLNALLFIADISLLTTFNPPPPQPVPRVGMYKGKFSSTSFTLSPVTCHLSPSKIGILFYRAHYLAGNTKVIEALCTALREKNLQPVPIFVSSLREPGVTDELIKFFQPEDSEPISLLLNTTSFSLARLETETPQIELWEKLDVPVLQVILCASSVEQWEAQLQGLTPRDMAMNVALPEVDGRIITRAVSFKSWQTRNDDLETDVVVYEPVSDRIDFVAQLAANWVRLRHKMPSERHLALILANYPNTNGRLANGVGLDTPASCVEILKALKSAGYDVGDIPADGDELIKILTAGVTNDPEGKDWKPVNQSLSVEEYQRYFSTLPAPVQKGIIERWGDGEINNPITNHQLPITNHQFPISGIQFGNVFVGIQPSRGYENDPSLNYHAPDLEPTHNYLAFYYWVREIFGSDAIVHVGKHGNLEWLPGKSVALSNTCYPEIAFGPMPHLYPFIVNDPGEGSQAKRRSQAVIIDHLTPPMTRAELYGALQQVENLIDEYYEAETLDPSRLPTLRDRIQELVIKENLYKDLGITDEKDIVNFESLILNSLDGYLCELKEAQIRDGLHIFGQVPQGRQLRDLIIAIARIPNRNSIGITRAIAEDWGLDFDPLTTEYTTPFTPPQNLSAPLRLCVPINSCRTHGDVIELLEEEAAFLVEKLLQGTGNREQGTVKKVLNWIESKLLPALKNTTQEITNLLKGLDGKYVPSAASGAPTRGRPEVLPTGKNFYAVDIRAIPTETAWDVGRKAAENLIETYTQEHGEYPKTLGLSVWGTSTMRTGGDDIAEALALLGVQPVWDGAARRVVDFEILPLSILGRPRVDVTLRISGFFRDAFPNLIDLFSQAVEAVASLDEPEEENPLVGAVKQDIDLWTQQGLSLEDAKERSLYRVFGSKPGAYGAGLQGLISSQNWQTDQDLAQAYINWSSYAYKGTGNREQGTENNNTVTCHLSPVTSQEVFEQRLKQMQVVLHNQDNREHDLLDSDDYYQFQGGLTAAVRSLQGKNPETYFGDNANTSQPKVRKLKEEITRVYRSRVVNPKWIEGVMRHGYKGAFEMAATVDFLFAYDATAQCVEDFMYQGIVDNYLQDPVVCEFIHHKNPWALRDIAERLLEANQRGLWQDVNLETLENLRNLVHEAEAAIEEK
ncbi:cobaltochelatase subunit CobN [Sphaerospermopsis torques-reginae]|uniref:Cobaltochelatase subunit CobN n=1 Tax=Sphaerospermopsis torques-reginae ITEP-024 TaxID=984208 RepID=A0ABX8X1T4_9CYAN|nr:cobaltochelatase subunit CobN [Sphaerospermopsis torques-reginae]QYX32670.1 cobaltochelatase subunit CobN [Sphaerospermopsis torques-reginae ITEP-024]